MSSLWAVAPHSRAILGRKVLRIGDVLEPNQWSRIIRELLVDMLPEEHNSSPRVKELQAGIQRKRLASQIVYLHNIVPGRADLFFAATPQLDSLRQTDMEWKLVPHRRTQFQSLTILQRQSFFPHRRLMAFPMPLCDPDAKYREIPLVAAALIFFVMPAGVM